MFLRTHDRRGNYTQAGLSSLKEYFILNYSFTNFWNIVYNIRDNIALSPEGALDWR